ncbi:hypothetical protein HMPREF0294_1975 [Corynebacterium glucuronolyticum ATCC 51867]|nr:hypothetical protein HMPREF0294_1975 [Corynebacterium glucuronolyticum ATCC 51867]
MVLSIHVPLGYVAVFVEYVVVSAECVVVFMEHVVVPGHQDGLTRTTLLFGTDISRSVKIEEFFAAVFVRVVFGTRIGATCFRPWWKGVPFHKPCIGG